LALLPILVQHQHAANADDCGRGSALRSQVVAISHYVCRAFLPSAAPFSCTKPAFELTSNCRYVITGLDDFVPGPEVDAMQPHYDDAYHDTAMGSSMSLAALRGQLGSAGVNTTKWWLDVQATILQTLQETVPKMEALRSYYYPAARSNFFTMLRLVAAGLLK
jgi:hypothetical protein